MAGRIHILEDRYAFGGDQMMKCCTGDYWTINMIKYVTLRELEM